MDKIIIEFNAKNDDSIKAHNRCLKSNDLVTIMKLFKKEKDKAKSHVKALIGNSDSKYKEDILSKKFEAIDDVYGRFEELLNDYGINLDTI
jgi:hypothetical protein